MGDTGGNEGSDKTITLDGVITREELSQAQSYNESLKGTREKARVSDKPLLERGFSNESTLPYNGEGFDHTKCCRE